MIKAYISLYDGQGRPVIQEKKIRESMKTNELYLKENKEKRCKKYSSAKCNSLCFEVESIPTFMLSKYELVRRPIY